MIDQSPGDDAAARERNCPESPTRRWLSVVEALLLGIVAIATAWGGYQAARWAGLRAAEFNQASSLQVQATRASTRAGQLSLYDVIILNEWFDAQASGRTQLASNVEQRFRPEFRPAFQAWLATDPLHNPQAPASPILMPQYSVSELEQAEQLSAKSSEAYSEGAEARQQSENYVLNAVFLATALFFLAIGPRFEWLPVRAAVLIVALGLVVFGIYHIFTYPLY
jgi:hypothetical protein